MRGRDIERRIVLDADLYTIQDVLRHYKGKGPGIEDPNFAYSYPNDRRRILTATYEIFCRRGVWGFSLGDVAKVARLDSPERILFYYPSYAGLIKSAVLFHYHYPNVTTEILLRVPTGSQSPRRGGPYQLNEMVHVFEENRP